MIEKPSGNYGKNLIAVIFLFLVPTHSAMADEDMRTEDEKIQAMLQQNTDMWSPQQDQS